ncbi:Hypothetical protein D9617_2g057470 [Elsinoe fawcettii]|nr:Hypothetical protein D9617_2g057470 [Elsinoe fawcettii]
MSAPCYFMSGDSTSVAQDKTYIPCDPVAVSQGKHSSCCAPNDLCFTNGLCKANSNNDWNWRWRVGCTDKTFKDPACPNYCRGVDYDDQAHLIFQCPDDQTWCCATGFGLAQDWNFTCCETQQLSYKLGPAVIAQTAALRLSTLTSRPVTASSLPSSPSNTPSSSRAGSGTTSAMDDIVTASTGSTIRVDASGTSLPGSVASSPATKPGTSPMTIGMAVGIPLGVLLIAALCYFFWRLGRKANPPAYAHYQKGSYSMTDGYSQSALGSQVSSVPPGMVYSYELDSRMHSQIDGREVPAELSARTSTLKR